MYKTDSASNSENRAKRNFVTLAAVLLVACSFFTWTHMMKHGKRGVIGPRHDEFIEMAYPQLQADQYRSAAELFEKEGKYAEADYHYRRYAEIAQQIYPDTNFDGVLGRILDLEGRHAEADEHYTKFEQFVTAQHQDIKEPATNATTTGRSVVANGRLLRILQTVPTADANKKFAYGKTILAERNLPAGELGMRASLVKLGKQLSVYTDRPGDTTRSITVPAETLRKLLSRIDRTVAVREFDFAERYYPGRNDDTLVIDPNDLSDKRVSGYGGTIASPRDLVPVDMAVIQRAEYSKLQQMAAARPRIASRQPSRARRYRTNGAYNAPLLTVARRKQAYEQMQNYPNTASPRTVVNSRPSCSQQYQNEQTRSAWKNEQPERKPFLRFLGKCLKAPVKAAGSVLSAIKRELND